MNLPNVRSTLAWAVCAWVAAVGVTAPAQAQEVDTLKKIKATQAITIGYRDVSTPFSYLDDKQRPIGYSIDLCLKIVDAIKLEIQSPKLRIDWQVVTSASRIPLIANGTIDIECGSTTNTIERQQQVSFVVTTFVAATRLGWKKASNFKSLEDLKGKRVVAVAGTTNLRQISQISANRALRITVVPVKDNNSAFAMLERGDVAAFATDDILLYGLIANAASPKDYAVSDEPLSVEPYGIMVRKDDLDIKQLADKAVRGLFASGEINKIYAKWFMSPIPPNGMTLKAPMSESLKKAIAKPTDSALPSDY